MPEEGKDMVEKAKKGGEVEERDYLGSQYRDRDKLISERRRARIGSRRTVTRSDIDESWIGKPEPGPQPSQIPFPQERMKFGPEVRQRRKR